MKKDANEAYIAMKNDPENVFLKNGSVQVTKDKQVLNEDGTVKKEIKAGTVMNADGSVVNPDGSLTFYDGTSHKLPA